MWFEAGRQRQAELERPVGLRRAGDALGVVAVRAISVERAWTLPLITTLLPLTRAFFFGEVIVTFGFEVSST